MRQSLIIARAHGADRVLLTCDADNLASSTVIEQGGGRLANDEAPSPDSAVRRYWID